MSSIARREASFLEAEEALLLEFLQALRDLRGEEHDLSEDRHNLTVLKGRAWSARALQEAATALRIRQHASALFPHFFAAMAVCVGVPSDEQRLRITRTRAALRLAARASVGGG